MSDSLSLPEELTIYTIGQLRAGWLQWLAESVPAAAGTTDEGELRLDARAVAEVDAAGVQLLLSLSRSLARQHRSLRLVEPSRALASACAGLGVAGPLGVAVGAP